MKVVIQIETNNDAFGKTSSEIGSEVARILRGYANKVEQGVFGAILIDINGNQVGSAYTAKSK